MKSEEPVNTIMFVSGRKPDKVVEQELGLRGLKVEWANSIKAATDLLDSTSERTGIVTDLALADGNWRDLVEHVRAVSSSIPIVVVSPASTAELWWDALDCDVEDILVGAVIGVSLVRSPGNALEGGGLNFMRLNTRQRTLPSAVFSKPDRRRFVGAFLAAALLILAGSLSSKGAELTPETLTAWDAYVQAQNARVAEYSSATPFLWSDQSPDRLRRLHKGETVVAPFGENPHRVPHGLIHHWIGSVFLPGARLDDVLSVVRDYGKYKDFYAPNVIESRVFRQTDTEDTFSLRMLNKAVVAKFALDTEFQNSFTRLDDNRSYNVSYTTRVREVENYGTPDEHEGPSNTGRGLLWRLYSISRFEQRDGGVYVELEAVALSRDVPGGLRWLVDPIVRRTSRGSIQCLASEDGGSGARNESRCEGQERQRRGNIGVFK